MVSTFGQVRTFGADLVHRPLTVADAPAWAELLAAVHRADPGREALAAAELAETLTVPGLDLTTDSLGVFHGTALVAIGLVRRKPTTTAELWYRIEADIHPGHRRRGIGAALLAWQRDRVRDLHRAIGGDRPGFVTYSRHQDDAARAKLFADAGLEPVRWFFDMECDLTTPRPAVPVPEGLRITGFPVSADEAVRLAYVETFGDHWGSPDADPEYWQHHFVGASLFRRDLSCLIYDGAEVAGYLLSFRGEHDRTDDGHERVWVGDIGVRRPWRRRGVAAALIAEACARYAAAGYPRAALGVDADNPTGALGVYRRAGFEIAHRWVTHAERLDAPDGEPRPSQGDER